jgi:hypothetical protein
MYGHETFGARLARARFYGITGRRDLRRPAAAAPAVSGAPAVSRGLAVSALAGSSNTRTRRGSEKL